MTAKQIEMALYEQYSYIDDKLRDIQANVRLLKNPEDFLRNGHCFNQIESCIADIRQAQNEIEKLQEKTPDEEGTDDYTGNALLNSLQSF